MLSDLKVQLPDSHVGDAWEDDRCGLAVAVEALVKRRQQYVYQTFEVFPTVSRSDGHLWTSGSYSHTEYSMAQISHGNLCFPAGYCTSDVSKLRLRPELPWFTPFTPFTATHSNARRRPVQGLQFWSKPGWFHHRSPKARRSRPRVALSAVGMSGEGLLGPFWRSLLKPSKSPKFVFLF